METATKNSKEEAKCFCRLLAPVVRIKAQEETARASLGYRVAQRSG